MKGDEWREGRRLACRYEALLISRRCLCLAGGLAVPWERGICSARAASSLRGEGRGDESEQKMTAFHSLCSFEEVTDALISGAPRLKMTSSLTGFYPPKPSDK